MKIYVNAQKLAVSCLNLALSWIHVNRDSSGRLERKKQKDMNLLGYAKLCGDAQCLLHTRAPQGTQRWSLEHGATPITALLRKTCKTVLTAFWPWCLNTSVNLWCQRRDGFLAQLATFCLGTTSIWGDILDSEVAFCVLFCSLTVQVPSANTDPMGLSQVPPQNSPALPQVFIKIWELLQSISAQTNRHFSHQKAAAFHIPI